MNAPTPCILGCRNPDGTPHRAEPGHVACQQCGDKLRENLKTLAKTYYDLTDIDEITPGGSGDNTGGSRSVPGSKSPAVDGLLVHSDPRSLTAGNSAPAALNTIEKWARLVRADQSVDVAPEHMRSTVPEGRLTMAREVQTLRFNWDWVLGQGWLWYFADDVRSVLVALRAARRMDAPTMRIGNCPTIAKVIPAAVGPDVELPCGAPLRVRTDATEIHCRNCNNTWPKARWHELGDGLTDYAKLADELDVKVGTLWRWASEDGWTVSGTRGRRLITRAEAFESYRKRRGGLPLEQMAG